MCHLQVAYWQNEKEEEEDSKGGWNLPLSSDAATLVRSCGIHPLLGRQLNGGVSSRLSRLILTPLLGYHDLVYCAERWEDCKELQRYFSTMVNYLPPAAIAPWFSSAP